MVCIRILNLWGGAGGGRSRDTFELHWCSTGHTIGKRTSTKLKLKSNQNQISAQYTFHNATFIFFVCETTRNRTDFDTVGRFSCAFQTQSPLLSISHTIIRSVQLSPLSSSSRRELFRHRIHCSQSMTTANTLGSTCNFSCTKLYSISAALL